MKKMVTEKKKSRITLIVIIVIILLLLLATVSINFAFNKRERVKGEEAVKTIYEDSKQNEESQSIKDTETVTYDIDGAFIKYNVEYTDVLKNYEYTSTNGWRLENYDLESDGKTLSNVRLISTGIPARMNYCYNDSNNNHSKWITDITKITEFKNNVLGMDYTTYTDDYTNYKSLQASAGYYYNLGQMTFEHETIDNTNYANNQGYYIKIKNINTIYTSGTQIGNDLFKARSDASIKMLTLPELYKALGLDINSEVHVAKGIYRLEEISWLGETSLENNKYDGGSYCLATPNPYRNCNKNICIVGYNGTILSADNFTTGIRPIISLESKVQLVKKTDDTGLVYYEMVNVN